METGAGCYVPGFDFDGHRDFLSAGAENTGIEKGCEQNCGQPGFPYDGKGCKTDKIDILMKIHPFIHKTFSFFCRLFTLQYRKKAYNHSVSIKWAAGVLFSKI